MWLRPAPWSLKKKKESCCASQNTTSWLIPHNQLGYLGHSLLPFHTFDNFPLSCHLSLPSYNRKPLLEVTVGKFLASIPATTCMDAAFQQLSQAKHSPCSKCTSSHLLLIIFHCHFPSFTLARTSSWCELAVHPLTFFPFISLPSSVAHIGSGYSSLRCSPNSSAYLLASLLTECRPPLNDFSSSSLSASIDVSGL